MQPNDLSSEDKLLHIFKKVHGEFSSSFRIEVWQDEDAGWDECIGVSVIKDGNLSWQVSTQDLLLDYIILKGL
jgi:hypothetical protein